MVVGLLAMDGVDDAIPLNANEDTSVNDDLEKACPDERGVSGMTAGGVASHCS
jgi:hypothetical protein